MDETRVCVVAEVERRQVDKVEDEQDLGPDEVGANEQHDEGEVQEVVDDEMAANCTSGVHMVEVAGEEVADVTTLEDPENNPKRQTVMLAFAKSQL